MMLASTLCVLLAVFPHDDVPNADLLRHVKQAAAELDALHEEMEPTDWAVLGHALAVAGDKEAALEALQRGIEQAAAERSEWDGIDGTLLWNADYLARRMESAGFKEEGRTTLRRAVESVNVKEVNPGGETRVLEELAVLARQQARVGDVDGARATRKKARPLYEKALKQDDNSEEPIPFKPCGAMLRLHVAARDFKSAFEMVERLPSSLKGRDRVDFHYMLAFAVAEAIDTTRCSDDQVGAHGALEKIEAIAKSFTEPEKSTWLRLVCVKSLAQIGDDDAALRMLAAIDSGRAKNQVDLGALFSDWVLLAQRALANNKAAECHQFLDAALRSLRELSASKRDRDLSLVSGWLGNVIETCKGLDTIARALEFIDVLPPGMRYEWLERLAKEFSIGTVYAESPTLFRRALEDAQIALDAIDREPLDQTPKAKATSQNAGLPPDPFAKSIRERKRTDILLHVACLRAYLGETEMAEEVMKSIVAEPDRDVARYAIVDSLAASGQVEKSWEIARSSTDRRILKGMICNLADGIRWRLELKARSSQTKGKSN